MPASDRAARTVHVITGLGVGGAETMLAKLIEAEVAAGDMNSRSIEVICLGAAGELAARIRATGVPVTCLGIEQNGLTGTLSGIMALARRLAALQPDVVQCWMYHADLIGGCVARVAAPRAARIWSIRASSMPYPASLRTRAVIRSCALLSWIVPTRIISCSRAAAQLHVGMGYDARRIIVIPNGFDLGRFQPDDCAKADLLLELGLPPSATLVGCVARFDPQKDFPTLLRAFDIVANQHSSATLIIAGKGCTTANESIVALIPPPIRDRVKLLGVRTDIPRLTAAFDVAVLTSAYGEGFPNVLGEALACGVPCVATDVGDSREIVGDDGTIAAVGDAQAIAAGISRLLGRSATERNAASRRMRTRALQNYALPAIARRYWEVQDEIAGGES